MKDTMTVIELLNKVANNEEVPDYIIWDGVIFEKDLETDYIHYTPEGKPMYFLSMVCFNELNDVVSIPSIELVRESKEDE